MQRLNMKYSCMTKKLRYFEIMLVITYLSNFFLVTYNVRYLKQYVGRNQGSQIGRFHGRLAENFFCWPLSKIIV